MRISKTPLRITLGGGGSDLGSGGMCINAAINLYTYVAVNEIPDPVYSLKYSHNERVAKIDDIEHSLIRRTLQHLDIPPGIEITTMSDVPAQTGLGSSGSFTVGLIRALDPHLPRWDVVRAACQLDTGMQDQFAATYGGLNLWRFGDPTWRSVNNMRTKLPIPPFFFNLALYDTGLRRDANEALAACPRPSDMVLRQQASNMRAALSDPRKFSAALDEQWATKYQAAPTPIHQYVDHQITLLKRNGAWGAKLIGAGDGGMILTFSQDIVQSPLRRIPIEVDEEGTRLIA